MTDLLDRLAQLPEDRRVQFLHKLKAALAGEHARPVVLARRERGARVPATYPQEQLWFLDRLVPGQARNNLAGLFRLRGQLDVSALRRALAEIIRRHEALRATFCALDGRPVQVIAPS